MASSKFDQMKNPVDALITKRMFKNAFLHHDLRGMSCRVGAADRGTFLSNRFF